MAIASLQDIRNKIGQPKAQYSPSFNDQDEDKPKSSSSGIQSLQDIRNKISGVAPDESQSTSFMDHPLVQQLSKIPGYAEEAAINLPGNLWNIATQVPGAAEKIVTHPIDAARDVGGGFTRNIQNLAAALLQGGEYVTRKGAEGILHHTGLPGAKVPYWNAREFMGLEGDNPIDLGKYVESKNPNALLSGIGQMGIPSGALGTKFLPFVAGSTLNAAIQAPPGETLRGATEGAVNTFLPPLAFKLGSKTVNAARPSNLFRGNLSPEELQANLTAAEGTNTGLGNVIESPTLKRLQENILPNIPFSGAYTAMQKTAQQLTEKGENLMGKIGENLPEGDKTQILQTALKKAAREAAQEKNANYQRVNKIADESGLVVGRGKFQTKAQEILDDIKQSPELEREFPNDLKADLQHYATSSEGNSLKLSNIFKGKLNDKVNDLYIGGKKYESGLVRELRDALGEDIESSIKASKEPGLKTAYETAQKEYGSKYAPFESPDITKFTREGGDPDLMLSHFLRTGANDRGGLISRLSTKLPKNLQNLPLHMYLSRAVEDGQLNPTKFETLYGKLGEKQRAALIPDKAMRKEIENYTRGVGMNKEAFQTMFNPKTGQRNLDSLVGTIEALAGYNVAGLKGAAIALPVGGIAGKLTNKALTSESLREGLVKAMLKQKK
jgi:hypothetical protein